MKDKRDNEFRLIGFYGLQRYSCGVKAGDKVRLMRNIDVTDFGGKTTGDIWREGEIWTVLSGSIDDESVVFLLNPSGDRCTWDNDQSFFLDFELL